MDCTRARELILRHITEAPLQSLDAGQLLRHITVCPACYEYLRSSGEAWHLLPYGVPELAPPPDLKDRVLQQAVREKTRRARGLGFRKSWLRNASSVAAAAVILLLAGFWWQGYRASKELLAEMSAARGQLQAAATLLTDTRQVPVQKIYLNHDHGFDNVWGVVSIYETRYGYVLAMSLGGLPTPEHSGVYRIWLLKDGKRTDCGSLLPDAAGYASVIMQMPDMEWEAIGITQEPDEKTLPEPRGPRVAFGQL